MSSGILSAFRKTYAWYFLNRFLGRRANRPVGTIDFGTFGSVHPVNVSYGLDRGLSVPRYYIEKFLAGNAADVHGRVLEMFSANYTKRFGGTRVSKSEVLSVSADEGHPTIVADLTDARVIESSSFDCAIVTQTLQLIYDVRAALKTLHRILVPGGILLVTVPVISQIHYDERGDYWRFTKSCCERLFRELFPKENLEVYAEGNVLSAISFLEGLSVAELTEADLEFRDPDYELIVCIRAVKER